MCVRENKNTFGSFQHKPSPKHNEPGICFSAMCFFTFHPLILHFSISWHTISFSQMVKLLFLPRAFTLLEPCGPCTMFFNAACLFFKKPEATRPVFLRRRTLGWGCILALGLALRPFFISGIDRFLFFWLPPSGSEWLSWLHDGDTTRLTKNAAWHMVLVKALPANEWAKLGLACTMFSNTSGWTKSSRQMPWLTSNSAGSRYLSSSQL